MNSILAFAVLAFAVLAFAVLAFENKILLVMKRLMLNL